MVYPNHSFVEETRQVMHSDSRFDAEKVVRVTTLTGERRFEVQFSDAQGGTHIVSLPLAAAIELGCLICDASEAAPYLLGGMPRGTSEKKAQPKPRK